MKILKTILALSITVTMFNSNVFAADHVLKLAHNGPEQHPFQMELNDLSK